MIAKTRSAPMLVKVFTMVLSQSLRVVIIAAFSAAQPHLECAGLDGALDQTQ
jgi:hypothetical protein